MSEWAHPAIPLLVGALVAAVAPAGVRRAIGPLAAATAFVLAWTLPEAAPVVGTVMGQPVVPLRVDPLGRAFALVFALVDGLGLLYGAYAAGRRLVVAGLVAGAAALVVVLAGDWITLYAAWEMLAVASFVLIVDGGTPSAARAGYRYLLVHLVGGAFLLAGIGWQVGAGGSTLVTSLPLAGAGALVLVAFAVNAAIPPLHGWLVDAYPESSPAAGVLLSAFATKSAVYALARVFPGADILVWAGVTMALYGVVFAVLESDIRRLLGYHIVSQVGYMVAGVGLGSPLAINGAVAHAFCHILYKGLLFMGAGAVVHATGRRTLADLHGLRRQMPATFALYMIGALSISGAPLLNGFVSKSLIVTAAHDEHAGAMQWLLLLAAVGTFVSVGLKLPVFTFGGSPRGMVPGPVPRSMLAAMALAALLCVLLGVAPALLYALLPFPVDYRPYTAAHVFEAVGILVGATIGFLALVGSLGGVAAVTLDFDRLYRSFGRAVATVFAPAVARSATALETAVFRVVTTPAVRSRRRRSPVGYAILTVLVALGALLLVLR